VFRGATINTPSMLCVADYLDALAWVKRIGGLKETIARCDRNLQAIEEFVTTHDWIGFLAADPEQRSNTSVCLSVDLEPDQVKAMVALLDAEGVAYDIGAYRDAPAGLRVWCGATVEESDIRLMLPWLEWAYEQVKQE
jgi:phosphoserine aminotransferase